MTDFKSHLNTQDIGNDAEDKSKVYLLSQGLRFIDRNYACSLGEIDLIMQESNTLIFVEVRYRKSNLFGGAAASVSKAKQARIIKTAQHYLLKSNLYEKCPVRFDVISYTSKGIDWIQGAFDC